MNLRLKIVLLATIPLVVAVAATTLLVNYQATNLARKEIAIFERTMLEAKRAELLNYISLAKTSIEHIYETDTPRSVEAEADAQRRVKRILNSLTYGPDGYFFAYDFDGNSLVHPKQTWRVDRNWWDLKDPNGDLVIQNLIRVAQAGGGFHRYYWEKPSIGEVVDKIGYAIALDRWKWMVGTGIYIDDVVKQVQSANADVSESIQSTFLLISGIVLTAILLVAGGGLAIHMHESKLADVRLQKLTQRVLDAQEEERAHVARELHDSISQILVAIKYQLELAEMKLGPKPGHGLKAIKTAAAQLNIAVGEVRRISRDLRPGVLDDLGLSSALESLTKEFGNRTDIGIDVSTTPIKDQLSREAKTALYRVAQEAFMNIERHSNANQAALSLRATRHRIVLQVSDNGNGFDPLKLNGNRRTLGGIGIRNMQERVEHFDGEFKIQSSAAGTVVTARLPKRKMPHHSETTGARSS